MIEPRAMLNSITTTIVETHNWAKTIEKAHFGHYYVLVSDNIDTYVVEGAVKPSFHFIVDQFRKHPYLYTIGAALLWMYFAHPTRPKSDNATPPPVGTGADVPPPVTPEKSHGHRRTGSLDSPFKAPGAGALDLLKKTGSKPDAENAHSEEKPDPAASGAASGGAASAVPPPGAPDPSGKGASAAGDASAPPPPGSPKPAAKDASTGAAGGPAPGSPKPVSKNGNGSDSESH